MMDCHFLSDKPLFQAQAIEKAYPELRRYTTKRISLNLTDCLVRLHRDVVGLALKGESEE